MSRARLAKNTFVSYIISSEFVCGSSKTYIRGIKRANLTFDLV